MYQARNGQVGDAAFRNQIATAIGGNAVIDGCGVALGSSTSAIETQVAAGVVKFGNEYLEISQQSVTHPSADPDNDRVDAIVVNQNGDATAIEGTPETTVPSGNQFPYVRTPTLPPVADDGLLVLAALWVPAGTVSSSELSASDTTPKRISGDGINDLELIPGRDLQHVIDNAREGQTLRGDRSQVITLSGPITVGTKNVTIRDVSLRYANGAGNSDADDMITLAADGVTVQNATLDGNYVNNQGAYDGISIQSSNCNVGHVKIRRLGGTGVVVNGNTGTTTDTIVNDVGGESLGEGRAGETVLVRGSGAKRTVLMTIRGDNNGSGTLRVRDGPTGVFGMNIYGENQDSTVLISDSGNADDAITSLFLDRIRSKAVRWILKNNTSTDVNHRGIYIARANARDLIHANNPGGGYIDLSGLSDIRITDSFLNGNWTDAYTIFANETSGVWISNCTLGSDASNYGCIGLFNSPLCTVTNSKIDAGAGTGVNIQANVRPVERFFISGNDIRGGTHGVNLVDSAGSEINRAIIKNNFTSGIRNTAAGANIIIKDNL